MDSRTIPFLREVPTEGVGAAPTLHGQVKPELGFSFEDDEAAARTIAGWTKVNNQDLEDVERLEVRIRSRVIAEVLKSLEAEVIDGSGVDPHLQGILGVTGLGDIAFDAGELGTDLVLDGIVSVLISGARPNVVALHPLDWASLLKAKTSGSGEYMGAGPFAAMASAIWDTATVPTLGLAPGTALIADTRLLARLYVRSGIRILLGTESRGP